MDGRFLDNNGEDINIVCHGPELRKTVLEFDATAAGSFQDGPRSDGSA